MKRLLLLLFFCQPMWATGQSLHIALTNIPRVLEYGRVDAPYNRLIEHVQSEVQGPLELDFMPSARANKLLLSGKVDCIFPIIPSRSRPIETIFSVPVNGISAYLFSLGDTTYTHINQMTGKTVVYLRGYLFADFLTDNPDVKFFPVLSQQAAIGMLELGRADAYIDYIPDIRYVFSDKELARLNYAPDSPVVTDFDYFECVKKPETERLMVQIDEVLTQLRQQQKLNTLLGKYYVPVEAQQTDN